MTTPPTREWQMPELPEPKGELVIGPGVDRPYTADQMREFGRQCAATKAPPMPEEVRGAMLSTIGAASMYLNREQMKPFIDWLKAQGLVSVKE